MLFAETRPVVHVAVQTPVFLVILKPIRPLRCGLQDLLANRSAIPILLCVDLKLLCRACVGKERGFRSRLGGVGRVTGSRSVLTSVAALLYRPVTLEGENLELILRAKDRVFSLAANREVREKARLGRNMLTFSSRAVEPPRAIVFFLFSTCAIVVVAASPASSSESSSFVRFLTLPRPNFPFFLNPPNPPALSEDAGGEETSVHDSMEGEDIARRAAGNKTYPGAFSSVLVSSGVFSSSPMTRTAPCAVYSGRQGEKRVGVCWVDTSFVRRTLDVLREKDGIQQRSQITNATEQSSFYLHGLS